jgi:hypothetical protein
MRKERNGMDLIFLTGMDRRGFYRKSLCSKPKGEALTHISVGQRPTYGTHHTIKAVSLAHYRTLFIRKAYSLDNLSASLRRALPYANMRKAFSLSRRSRN